MSVCNVAHYRRKRGGLSVLTALCCLVLAFQIGLISSPTTRAASTADQALGSSQALDFAGVSVVRLVVTYKPADQMANATPSTFAQCTGLGVIVSSWQSQNDDNNWIMTDGNLVNPTMPSCLPKASTTPLLLANIDLYFNTTFSSVPMAPLPVLPSSVHCLVVACSGNPALLSFQSTAAQTYPHVNLSSNTAIGNMSIPLGLNNSIASFPASSNTNPQLRDQYGPMAKGFLTERVGPVSTSSGLESGTPVFNQAGELSSILLSNKVLAPVADLATLLNTLPNIRVPSSTPATATAFAHSNVVYDNWKKGVASYYRGDYPTANTAFQTAARGNALFTAPGAFEQLIAQRSSTIGGQAQSGAIRIKFWFIDITIPDVKMLIVFIITLLGALLVFVMALSLRGRAKRRLRIKEYREAERAADQEAQRLVAMEVAQQWLSPAAPIFTPRKVKTSPLSPTLSCPQCGVPVGAEDKFCANCRVSLVPTESGFHVRVTNSPLLPVQPIQPVTKSMENSASEGAPERRCPRCNTMVPQGATYCPNCRLKQATSDMAGQQLDRPVSISPIVAHAPPTIPFTPIQPSLIEVPPASVPSPALSIPSPSLNESYRVSHDPKIPAMPIKKEGQRVVSIGTNVYINQRLGNYRIKSLLGHGGFADVYLGEHVFLKTRAAIKVLHRRLTSSDLASFLHEARTIASLNHTHIIRVLDFGVEGNEPDIEQSSFDVEGSIPFLIMDYAPGGTLRKRYPKGTRVPLSIIVPYVKQVAAALQYAHDRKLIHRDIKPENILLSENDVVLLSDFGIVAVAHGEHSMSIQEMAGTAPYMAPEQIKGKPRPASDQYSLAVVVYEWLSGNRPFQGDTSWGIIEQHLSILPAKLCAQDPSLPSRVDDVVLKALAKDPSQRFESVSAFAAALEQVNTPLIFNG